MTGAVLIPAFNEERVLPATLTALLEGLPADVEVLVCCNGCRDGTAAAARGFAPRVRVLEIEEASKVAAIAAAERKEPAFPRIYLDADVRLRGTDAARLLAALAGGALAAEGVPEFDLSESSAAVRAFYAVWLALHGRGPGDVGGGFYALSRAGRARFGEFPRVISDDGFVRAHFGPGEIQPVREVRSLVRAPRGLPELIRIKARSRLGSMELAARFPDLWRRKSGAGASLGAKFRRLPPRLWPLVPMYVCVQLAARRRARRFARDMGSYRWERDESTR